MKIYQYENGYDEYVETQTFNQTLVKLLKSINLKQITLFVMVQGMRRNKNILKMLFKKLI